MKQTNAELEAIKKKLQSLQADPYVAETISLPWSVSKGYAPSQERDHTQEASDGKETSSEQNYTVTGSASSSKRRQEVAFSALQQRSHATGTVDTRTENITSKTMYRLETLANNINDQSQKQAQDILAFRRSVQQAYLGLRQEGIPESHPTLLALRNFLQRYASTTVVSIEKDDIGEFTFSYETVDLHRAEREAQNNAHMLRRGWQEETVERPLEPPRQKRNRLQKSLGNLVDQVLYLFGQNKRRRRQHAAQTEDVIEGLELGTSHLNDLEEGIVESDEKYSRADASEAVLEPWEGHGEISLLDGAIWFSAAAIARIVVQSVALSYPIVQTLFVIAIGLAITFALYRLVIVQTNNYSAIYRICAAIAGLFLIILFRG